MISLVCLRRQKKNATSLVRANSHTRFRVPSAEPAQSAVRMTRRVDESRTRRDFGSALGANRGTRLGPNPCSYRHVVSGGRRDGDGHDVPRGVRVHLRLVDLANRSRGLGRGVVRSRITHVRSRTQRRQVRLETRERGGPGWSSRIHAAFPDALGCSLTPRARVGAEPSPLHARAPARAPNPARVRSAFVETNTAPTRYPSHRPSRSAVRCRAVRSSSPSKRGEKAQLSTGKDGRGKTVSTSAVSPPNAEIGACPPPHSRVGLFRRPRADLSCRGKTWRRAQRPPPNGPRAAQIKRRDVRGSPICRRRGCSASGSRLPARPSDAPS